jgi:hypothetical protein
MTEITILNGLVGGVLATILMTVLMMALGDDSPPPTALFLATYVGDGDAVEYMLPGLLLHLLYGTGAGVVLAAVMPAVGFETASLIESLGIGLGYGVLLFVGAAVFWMNIVLDMDPEPGDIGRFALFHLVYGGVLGAVIGAGLV